MLQTTGHISNAVTSPKRPARRIRSSSITGFLRQDINYHQTAILSKLRVEPPPQTKFINQFRPIPFRDYDKHEFADEDLEELAI